eukprot:578282-Prymnesium_polylepis.1
MASTGTPHCRGAAAAEKEQSRELQRRATSSESLLPHSHVAWRLLWACTCREGCAPHARTHLAGKVGVERVDRLLVVAAARLARVVKKTKEATVARARAIHGHSAKQAACGVSGGESDRRAANVAALARKMLLEWHSHTHGLCLAPHRETRRRQGL